MSSTQTPGGNKPLAYMPQLDGLRALAVFGVFVEHWAPRSWQADIPFGLWGVRLFFVLSGFLITLILLRCRDYIDRGNQSVLFTARQFYVRRVLRIFPLYYATLVLMQIGVGGVWPWHVLYLSNVQFALAGQAHWVFGYFWTLSVEEQFYMVWPWLIFLCPRSWLLPGIAAVVVSAPLFRLWGVAHDWSETAVRVLTPSCLDTLGMGALLALLAHRSHGHTRAGNRLAVAMLAVGLPLLCLNVVLHWQTPHTPFQMVTNSLAQGLVFGWLVWRASDGFSGVAGKVLSLPVLVYLGRISYGLYVLHGVVQGTAPDVLQRIDARWFDLPAWMLTTAGLFWIRALLTVALASLSWKLFEYPLNEQKRWFPYKRPVVALPAQAAA